MARKDNWEGPRITLGDGTEIHGDVSISGSALWILIRDPEDKLNSIQKLGNKLSRAEAAAEITRSYGEEIRTYTGYNKLTQVKYYNDSCVGARLKKG